jgi:nucleotide-binding universal stress UspA family protein
MSNMESSQPHTALAPSRERLFLDVLCAVDGTHRSYLAVEQAAALAGPQGRLTLLAVTATSGSGAHRSAAASPSHLDQVLDRAREIAMAAGVSEETLIDASAPPQEAILAHARARDLLALGAPASSWIAGLLLEGVAASTLGKLTMPLLAGRSPQTGEHRFGERILLASDGRDGSDELVELAGRLAREQESAAVTLAHAVGSESEARPHRIEGQLQRLQDTLQTATVELRIEVGHPAEAIVQLAEESSASLIVMGSRRLEGPRAIGSVSRRVVHEGHCSVLLVPPESLRG